MPDDKALIASSEFDPTQFVKGIESMTNALDGLLAKEDEVKSKLAELDKALTTNRTNYKTTQDNIKALDQSSDNYKDSLAALNKEQQNIAAQQKDIQAQMKTNQKELQNTTKTANDYKTALGALGQTAKQVQDQNRGKGLFDSQTLNNQLVQLQNAGSKLRDIFKGKVDTAELDKLEDSLVGAKDEFQQLAQVIDFVEQKMSTLDPNTQEFADLNAIVKEGKDVLEAYGEVQDNVGNRSKSTTARLKELKQQLTELQLAGKADTAEFKAIQAEAAELQDAVDKTSERVRAFANDFRLIQGSVEALRGIAAGFELAQGASALFGVKNEAVEESIKRLSAIMAIANGLQEVSNLLKKESTVRLVAEEVATKAYTISQRILAATLGTTAAASRGLAVALAATGIGALVVAIGLLITIISNWESETKKMTEAQKQLNVDLELSISFMNSYIAAIGDAEKVIAAEAEVRQASNEKIRQSDVERLRQRIRNVEELRNIDIRFTEQQLEEAKKREAAAEDDFNRASDRLKDIAAKRIESSDEEVQELKKTTDDFEKIQETRFALEHQLEIKRLNDQRDRLRERNELRALEIQQTEDFLKRLEELRKRLLDAQNKQARQDEAQLAKQAGDNLNAELRNIDREIRQGKLTRDQGNLLKNLLRQINGVELTTELREFHKKVVDASTNLENEIFNLRLTAGEKRTELLRDQLTKQAQEIEDNFNRETKSLEVERDQLLKGVRDTFDQGLISEDQARQNSEKIRAIYEQLFLTLTEQTRRKQEELANAAFERSQQLVQQLFAPSFTTLTEQTTAELEALTTRFVNNRITFAKYQQELTEITRRESQRRIELQITENEELLRGVQLRLQAELDPARRQELQARILQLREEIAQLRRQAAEGEAAQEKALDDQFKQKVQRIANYAQAIGQVVDQVVQFWARANEAEQKQLEASIAIQEKRVDAATRIAERGNAEYLRLEEDRLQQLQIRQENAARRQLAINAVLQTSQALTAFVSALAQGIATGGPLGGIAIAAAVIGLIASGFAIIQSLSQNNTPKLKEGTKYLTRDGHPAGEDTIPAMLNEGEAVIPTHRNREYKPAVEAIFDATVPAEDMNRFVQSYKRTDLPRLDYDRMTAAAATVVTYDGRLLEINQEQNRLLDEQNERLATLDRTMKSLGVNVNVDKNGLAIAVMKAVEQERINKKV